MSRTYRKGNTGRGRQRRISVRGVRREQPDVHKLSRALLQLVMEQAAAEAAAEASEPSPGTGRKEQPAPSEEATDA